MIPLISQGCDYRLPNVPLIITDNGTRGKSFIQYLVLLITLSRKENTITKEKIFTSRTYRIYKCYHSLVYSSDHK